jgi:farnesyl-diphosphate farnesyltransferase
MNPDAPDVRRAWATCFRHLPKVSRTFALAIDGLPEPLRGEVCVAYLLCRVLDTVEDAPGLRAEERWGLIGPVLASLRGRAEVDGTWLAEVERLLAPCSGESDLALLRDAATVVAAFRSCRAPARNAVARWVTEMGKGMVLWSARMGEDPGQVKTLRTVADLDRYCYYIAGTVGYLLTDLFFIHSPRIDQALFYELQNEAEAFGLGLQKVNIVKDLADDLRRGWCFIPTDLLSGEGLGPEAFADPGRSGEVYRAVRPVLLSAKEHLECAWKYLEAIPTQEREIRLFLAYSLFFALETLALVARDPEALTAPEKLKIGRLDVARIVSECQIKIGDPPVLRRMHERMARPLQDLP